MEHKQIIQRVLETQNPNLVAREAGVYHNSVYGMLNNVGIYYGLVLDGVWQQGWDWIDAGVCVETFQDTGSLESAADSLTSRSNKVIKPSVVQHAINRMALKEGD
jgi:hypothetical protein